MADRSDLFATPSIERTERPDGSMWLASTAALGPYSAAVGDWLTQWADVDPAITLVAERGPDGGWRRCSYGEALESARGIAHGLRERGVSTERPLVILSGNSVGHLLVTLGAFLAGVPVAPVSVAYSLQSRDHARLRAIGELVDPGAVYVEDADRFAGALDALGPRPVTIAAAGGPAEHGLAEVTSATVTRIDPVNGDTIAKFLFTSGSTGTPKGVLTTHDMLTSNQQMMREVWPFLTAERPVLVDWLPWSHTFGGSHNVDMVLANGGTIYIDEGRPTPGLIDTTVANYCDVGPTIAFNVPAGYAQLVPALEHDRELAERFFARLQLVFNASAALPSALRTRLERLGREVTGRDVPVTGSWGTTETSPAATTAHFDYTDARCIGVPLPGATVKLVPAGDDTYELRCRGRLVTPGYAKRPDLTASLFDDEGFYRPGDAVSLADPDDPNAGLLFRGRLAEDFKLSTGTFVHVGALRTGLLSAAPVLADAVITGEDRDEVGALAWLNAAEVTRLFGPGPADAAEVVDRPELASHVAQALAQFNADKGSASRVCRVLLMSRPASLDVGEITDKGYVNQRMVLATRVHLVELLYADTPPPELIMPAG